MKFVIKTNNGGARRPRAMAAARLCLLCLLCIGAAMPAAGQLFSDDAAREQASKNAKQLANLAVVARDLNKKVIALEKENKNYKKILGRVSALSQQQQKLADDVRSLRGQIEENAHQLGGATDNGEQIQLLKTQLSALSKKVEKQATELSQQLTEIQEYATLPDESELYNAAFASFQKRQFETALSGFRRVVKFYPNGKFAANARYWVSNAHLALEDYAAAMAAAKELIAQHTGNDKVPDGMLILARAQGALGRQSQMETTLRQIIADYPTSLAGDKARQLLAE